MVIKLNGILSTGLVAAGLTAIASAAPRLQLPQTPLPVISVTQGQNGSIAVDAKNVGDGTLALQATGSSSWLVPTIGAAHNCTDGSGPGCFPVQIALQTSTLARGNYTGFVTVNDPNATDAPQLIPVSVQIGTGVPDKIDITVPAGGSASTRFSTSSSALVTSDANAKWLTAVQDGGNPFSPAIPYKVTASAGSMPVGDYAGSVTVVGAATSTDNKTVPVALHIVKPAVTGPLANIGGALNNTTYAAGESLAQGDIAALFGVQFMTGDPQGATALPLSTSLAGVTVSLNNQPVPLYYVSPGQINFQVPFNAAIGPATLRVDSNGQRGNTISLTIAKAVPRILRLNGLFGDYGIVTGPGNALAIPAPNGQPVKVGSALTIYTIGLGPTSPAVESGAGSPSAEPLARTTNNVQVCFAPVTPFNPGLCVAPLFSGLAPGFVGLYQINVVVPAGSPAGDKVPIHLATDDGDSNTVDIAIQP